MIDSESPLYPPALRVRNGYLRARCRWHAYWNNRQQGSDRPWDHIVIVSPDAIEYMTYGAGPVDYGHPHLEAGAFDKITQSGAIRGGNWDRRSVPFSELYIYEGLSKRLADDVAWQETRFFDETVELIRAGETPWGCSSSAELLARCRGIDEMVETIRTEGYKSQRALGKAPIDEVTVNVGRDGRLLFNDGRHRLSIAKLLDVERIPVRVVVEHEHLEPDARFSEQ